jgi:hypothetical protein
LAQAGAAGVLTRLVLVGVSINLQKIVSDPSSGLPRGGSSGAAGDRAHGVHLAPRAGTGHDGGGAEVLTMGLAAWGCVVAIQLLRLRSWRTIRPDLRGAFVLRVALGQVATLPLVIADVAVLAGAGGLYWLVPGTFSRSSWLCLPRRCCSSRSTGSNRPGIPIALSTRVRGMRSANFAH